MIFIDIIYHYIQGHSMRYKNVDELVAGDILAMPIILPGSSGNKSRTILQQNVVLTPYHIKRLKTLSRAGVFVFDTISNDIIVKQNVSPEIKYQAAEAVVKGDINACLFMSKEIADSLIVGDTSIKMNIESLGDYDAMTYLHSVNVSVYSGLMGIMLRYPYDRLKNLILAGLLHDIGKQKIDINIINKPGPLDDEEREIINKHVLFGYEMLKNQEAIPSVVRVSVLQHHENVDGSGYLYGLKEHEIYEFAKILHLCDVYDAMISKRSYKNEIDPREVTEYIMGNAGTMFNSDFVKLFVQNTVLYPEGVVVLLSDGNKAIVKENHEGIPSRPLVKLLPDGEEIDLLEVINITITKICI